MSPERRPGHDPAAPATDLDPSAFVDRVMDSIEAAPAPTPARSFAGAVRGWSLDDALASLAVAWHLGTVRSWSVAPRVRARSMALVLAVASVLATGSLVAAAAVRVVAPVGMDDHHMAPATVPVMPIADPRLDEPGTDGPDHPTPADADHHVTDPGVETHGGQPAGNNDEHGATDSGSHDKDTNDDGSSHDGDQAGSGSHEGTDAGDDTHAGGSTSGSHDGGTSDDGSHRSGGSGGHDDSGSSDSSGSHDGNDGGD